MKTLPSPEDLKYKILIKCKGQIKEGEDQNEEDEEFEEIEIFLKNSEISLEPQELNPIKKSDNN